MLLTLLVYPIVGTRRLSSGYAQHCFEAVLAAFTDGQGVYMARSDGRRGLDSVIGG